MASRDLDAARAAYESGDIERSRLAHERGNHNTPLLSSSSVPQSTSQASTSSSSSSSSSSLSPIASNIIDNPSLLSSNSNTKGLTISTKNHYTNNNTNDNNQNHIRSSTSAISSSSLLSTSTPSIANVPAMCEPGHQTDTPFGKTFIAAALDGKYCICIYL